MHQISAPTLCLQNREGGLGITDLKAWNTAAYLGFVFKIASKEKNLWVNWCWSQLIKEKHFWSMKMPRDCSWVWKHILKARTETIKHVRYSIADGKNTLLWHDPWLSDSLLILDDLVRDEWSSLDGNSKVSVLITDGKWNHLVHNLHNLQLKEKVLAVEINLRKIE
ncbi:hypothetical protein FRX31_005534 [Thalictrum thalictroides]|uniref:Uncharacterized protein n=1 Tax=Thalictrum thalictroides TaxID=46969 RepID=A0A7J6X563_THATH|nr:hypothetical protein FRX31_005534 [Thalictrum thalictroides]